MSDYFGKIKSHILDLGLGISNEIPDEGILVIDDEENGIKSLVLDCEDPILVLEQFIMNAPKDSGAFFQKLLQINRELVHGAFVLDENGEKIFWHDTLQIANLDLNELEGSIHALSLGLAEYGQVFLDNRV